MDSIVATNLDTTSLTPIHATNGDGRKHSNNNQPQVNVNSNNVIQEEVVEVVEVTAFQDFIAGGIAGTASVVVGHPFDTIKVRLQTSSSVAFTSNLSSLYRGMAAPLSTAAVVNALIFSSFGYSSRLWDKAFESNNMNSLDLQKSFVCGSFAGLVQAVVICPMEHIKCRLQVTNGPSYSGPTHVVSEILANHGIRGLFRGWCSTLWREVPAFGMYFVTYDYVKDSINSKLRSYDPTHSHSWMASAISGGISGSLTWAMIYPFDIIKTKIQTAPLHSTKPSQSKIWYVAKDIVTKHGWRHLFRGLGITLVRAFPVNGIIFPVYEFTLMQLNQLDVAK